MEHFRRAGDGAAHALGEEGEEALDRPGAEVESAREIHGVESGAGAEERVGRHRRARHLPKEIGRVVGEVEERRAVLEDRAGVGVGGGVARERASSASPIAKLDINSSTLRTSTRLKRSAIAANRARSAFESIVGNPPFPPMRIAS